MTTSRENPALSRAIVDGALAAHAEFSAVIARPGERLELTLASGRTNSAVPLSPWIPSNRRCLEDFSLARIYPTATFQATWEGELVEPKSVLNEKAEIRIGGQRPR